MPNPTRAGREGESQPLPKPGGLDVSTEAQKFITILCEEKGTPQFGKTICEDLESRIKIGVTRYGQRLQTDNGRDMLLDMYEECLDAYHYAWGHYLEHPSGEAKLVVEGACALLCLVAGELKSRPN